MNTSATPETANRAPTIAISECAALRLFSGEQTSWSTEPSGARQPTGETPPTVAPVPHIASCCISKPVPGVVGRHHRRFCLPPHREHVVNHVIADTPAPRYRPGAHRCPWNHVPLSGRGPTGPPGAGWSRERHQVLLDVLLAHRSRSQCTTRLRAPSASTPRPPTIAAPPVCWPRHPDRCAPASCPPAREHHEVRAGSRPASTLGELTGLPDVVSSARRRRTAATKFGALPAPPTRAVPASPRFHHRHRRPAAREPARAPGGSATAAQPAPAAPAGAGRVMRTSPQRCRP